MGFLEQETSLTRINRVCVAKSSKEVLPRQPSLPVDAGRRGPERTPWLRQARRSSGCRPRGISTKPGGSGREKRSSNAATIMLGVRSLRKGAASRMRRRQTEEQVAGRTRQSPSLESSFPDNTTTAASTLLAGSRSWHPLLHQAIADPRSAGLSRRPVCPAPAPTTPSIGRPRRRSCCQTDLRRTSACSRRLPARSDAALS